MYCWQVSAYQDEGCVILSQLTARIAPHVANGCPPRRVHYYIFNVINYHEETADADFLLAHNQQISTEREGVFYYRKFLRWF